MVWTQSATQVGLAERPREDGVKNWWPPYLHPTIKMWGARSPSCLALGNPQALHRRQTLWLWRILPYLPAVRGKGLWGGRQNLG